MSPYHRVFLQRLNDRGIRYLVVGGQARRQCRGDAGHDLDLWLDYSDAARPVILAVMLEWGRNHPMHVADLFLDRLPSELRNNIQLKFPVWDGVRYQVDGGPSLPVSIATGIDVLIGGSSALPFSDCFDRAAVVDLDGLVVHCLHSDDDEQFPRLDRVVGAT